uniref:Serpentine receptor class gamma n=1 Tax=Panagrolaimus sp. PS1159 TaxID=55785 RepID=A0AC35ESX4_9BILA
MDAEAIYYANLKLLLPYIYLIPTYILYLVILYVMFISKFKTQFYGSFYKIFGLSAIFNVICSILYNLQVRFPQTPALISIVHSWGSRSFFVTFLQTGIWYTYNVAHLLNFFISFNRFTVFLLKIHYNAFWRKWLSYFIGICLIVPCFLMWHVPFTDIYLKPKYSSDPNGLWNYATGHPEIFSWMSASRFTVFLLTGTASCSLIFNCYVILQLVKDNFTPTSQKKTSKQDIKLSFYAMVVFASDMIYCVQQVNFERS